MRRRFQRFLPIVLIALVVQVLAPIGACWAAAIAASGPLGSAVICHDSAAASGRPGDQGGDHRAHNGACAICCICMAGAAIDTPQQAGGRGALSPACAHGLAQQCDHGTGGGSNRFQRPGARTTAS